MAYTKNPDPCGTQNAYRRHLYRREEPCADCRQANAREIRMYNHEKRRHKPRKKPACGTYAGAQWHRNQGHKPCDPCRLARNEYMRELRAGVKNHSKYDEPTQAEVIEDVLETRGYPMTAEVICDLVLELHPEWSRSSIRTSLVRMDSVERIVRLGENLWRLTT